MRFSSADLEAYSDLRRLARPEPFTDRSGDSLTPTRPNTSCARPPPYASGREQEQWILDHVARHLQVFIGWRTDGGDGTNQVASFS